MEKAKAYIKNELRGGSLPTQSEPTTTPPPSKVQGAAELMPSPGAAHRTLTPTEHQQQQYIRSHQQQQQQPQHPSYVSQSYYQTAPVKAPLTGRVSAPPEHIPICYVCGGHGGYEPLRVRPNHERPNESYFPFLERHEPPNGVPSVGANQLYVMACMLCYRSLNEQWDSYERQKKPLLQRIYHMKRVDGKGYIGADVATQSEYAAQMLGLSAEHLTQNGLSELQNAAAAASAGYTSADPYALVRHYGGPLPSNARGESPHHSTSRNGSPAPSGGAAVDYYPRNLTPTSRNSVVHNNHNANSNDKYLSRPQSRDMQMPSPSSRPPSATGAGYEQSTKSSSFAHHKFKLSQHAYSAASPGQPQTPYGSNPPSSPYQSQSQAQQQHQYHPHQYQQLQQQTAAYHMLQQAAAGTPDHQALYKGNPYNAMPVRSPSAHMPQPPTLEDDNATVLDLRHSSSASSGQTARTTAAPPPVSSTNNHGSPAGSQVEVGILDLSMPDKNSITEVCYVCGDEQRRGSLVELSTVKPKDSRDRHQAAYFPLFNEQHPRPARSRPKDPRGMIQACMPCYEDLMQQWNAHQASHTPEAERSYTLRKRPVPVTERTTFVCYTCGCDTPSSQLRLVYCCPNAEREPYYPFIKTMKVYKNASPISPQGMVQVCANCNEKHANLAEGGVPAAPLSNAVVGSPGAPHHLDSGSTYGAGGVVVSVGGNGVNNATTFAGHNTPSEKSLANSDSTSNVRFKPYESNSNNSNSNTARDLKQIRRTDSRPSSPTSTQGPIENGHGQYPCSICKVLCASNKMEWLSTSAEHMNSHAMHFPCLKASNNSNGVSNNNNNNNELNSNRVLACKDCVNYLARQWETMDAERVPLEHRRYNIPSPMMSSSSPNGSRHGAMSINTPPSTPSISSSTAASTSIYCFLCGLHSDLTLARILYGSKEGSRPYFPLLLKHNSLPNAEQLRNNSALVCTFCYHSMLNQWRKYEAQSPSLSPADRKYNWHDYICHLCGITTYRKRVRALPVNEFPFVKNRKNDDGLLLENGEYAVVCLDCYESLRQQASQHDRFGVPISRRAYNWVPQPPPPEDSPDAAVARLPCGERSDRILISNALRPIPSKKTTSPKQYDKSKEVPPKAGQKRPATSPAPHIPVPHHLQTPPGAAGSGNGAPPPPPTSALLNHALPANHIGGQSPSSALAVAQQQQQQQQQQQAQQQQHQAHQQAMAAAVQQHLVGVGVGVPPGAINASAANARGSFAAALRTLAKQADIKEEDDVGSGARERSAPPGGGGGVAPPSPAVNPSNSAVRSGMQLQNERSVSGAGGATDERTANKKRSPPSPQPPEKIARLSHTPQAASIQPELLARSGFQPYRSDERLMHPAGPFPLEAYSHFAGLSGIPPAFLNPGMPYSDPLYLEHRYQLLRAAGAHHSHPHAAALYPPMPSPYSHLYSMIPGAALGISPAIHDRLKLEEEHRQRMAREEEREREMHQREKERELREQREREQREKEQREREQREQREKEQREKEQKEKEAREREMREKEREARERERQQLLNASHHYSNQLYSPLNRNLLGSMIPHLNLGLRGPPTGLHGLPGMSPYHAANAQRQSPHAAMGLNLGLPGLPGVTSLGGHGPPNLQHHLQQALSLPHPGAAGLTHPGFSAAAALGLSPHPHSLNLSHPHISPHHPSMSAAHQLPPHTSSAGPSTTAASALTTSSSSPHNSLNLTSSGAQQAHAAAAAAAAAAAVVSLPTTMSSSVTASTSTPSSHIPHFYHHGHLAAMHAAAAASGLAPAAAHQQPISLASSSGGTSHSHSHPTSPTSLKISPPVTATAAALVNSQNGQNRTASSPHAMRHHIAAAVAAAHQSALIEKSGNATSSANVAPSTHEPTTLDLTGSNSNSSNQTPSNASSSMPNPHELNGVESNGPTDNKEPNSGKDAPLKSVTPPVATLDKKPATPTTASNNTTEKTLLPDSSPDNSSRRSASPPSETNTSLSASGPPAAEDNKASHLLGAVGRSSSAEEATAL
ncbi:uncharacterized protein LOC115620035 isoform X2 [Scaptodrosophila lebanonensis]|uniref:Uncharacterized protein LOC115620035 isoform X2 n=1 Tax=Drosophila lebanonensis TaxID=7225 RepID=A0A6J2T271_DROLE|nr:uncharacterized protein LOC115620035 isoform X2 [Scaptodrosophila lebanonensis]